MPGPGAASNDPSTVRNPPRLDTPSLVDAPTRAEAIELHLRAMRAKGCAARSMRAFHAECARLASSMARGTGSRAGPAPVALRRALRLDYDAAMDREELRRRVDALADEPDRMRRRLVALSALSARLAEEEIQPILVGGCALEVYTDGGYTTGDVDLALDASPEVDAAFADLGFEKEGRFWVRESLDLVFEAPAPGGLPGETAPRTVLDVDGLPIVVLGVEDLLLDRLRAWVHWKSDEDRRWASRLVALYAAEMDWPYLRDKVAADDAETAALASLEQESR